MTNKTPCEIIVWKVLPAIRRELAIILINDHGFSQKEAAEKLGLTEAAVSRYVSGKRGELEIPNGKVRKSICTSVEKIIKGKDKTVIIETCRICELLKNEKVLDGLSSCMN